MSIKRFSVCMTVASAFLLAIVVYGVTHTGTPLDHFVVWSFVAGIAASVVFMFLGSD